MNSKPNKKKFGKNPPEGSKKFYIMTAIPYVNAAPHIGFAMELIQADVLARYYRLKGFDVRFLTGTDEHGSKIYKLAGEQGITPQRLVDENAAKYVELGKAINSSHDDFIRTTSERHKSGVLKIWDRLTQGDDIYKGKYEGLYCVGCEAFLLEKDLVDGKCPHHLTAPEKLSEENYFFRLSKYSYQIRDLIESDELLIVPEKRKHEMLNIIGEEGLHDVSFSRPKKLLPWGIPVPQDPEQVMYVWPDALSNYMTAVDVEHEGPLFYYWPADVHLIGKDILRFHAGIWIGMLLSAGYAIPKSIMVHGFVTSDGQKMSKSLGNVIDPFGYISEFGADPLRYYLMKEIPTLDDGDFTRDRFLNVYRSNLANSLGNLIYRILSMTEKYFDGKVPEKTLEVSKSEVSKALKFGKWAVPFDDISAQYDAAFSARDLKRALELVIQLIDRGNEYVDSQKPWSLAKTDPVRLSGVMYELLELLRLIAVYLNPFIPQTAEKIFDQLQCLDMSTTWGRLIGGNRIVKKEPLFPKEEKKV